MFRRQSTAHRAIARWAVRLFVRERRQQVLLIGVVAIAVAAAVCAVVTISNLPDPPAGPFGTAHTRITYSADDSADLSQRIEKARAALGVIEVIGHGTVPIPGSTDTVELRYEDPHGTFGASTIRLRSGRLPASESEAAITPDAGHELGVSIGGTLVLGAQTATIVGVVENPYDLGDEFVLAPPAAVDHYTSATILTNASGEQRGRLRVASALELRRSGDSKAAAAGTLAASTVVFLLVALVAAAGFAVVAQRRLSQLGMLAAVGARDRHLRLVLIVHGALVGLVAAVAGTVLGLGGWLVLAHRLEHAAGHRIDVADVPWSFVSGAFLAGLLVPVVAAWWPARMVARLSIVDAVSSRPPQPRRTRFSVLAAIAALAVGVALTALSDQTRPLPLIAGVAAIVVGILFVCPAVVRLMARFARRAPITARIALRDLGRYQARAGAALAAISVALGVPVAIILVVNAQDRTAALSAGDGNLADTQMIITVNHPTDPPIAPDLSTAEQQHVQRLIDGLATSMQADVTPLDGLTDPAVAGRPLIELGFPVAGNDHEFHSATVVASSPQLLSLLGIDATTVAADADLLTSSGSAVLIRIGGPGRGLEDLTASAIDSPRYTSLPHSLLLPSRITTDGLEAVTVGWILQSPHPLTAAQIDSARLIASRSALRVEVRHGRRTTGGLRLVVGAAGAVFALAIVAMTVGTIRSEGAGELRTLAATGASGSIRRALTGVTAAALAFGGVVLGTVGATLAMIGAYWRHLDRISDLPVAIVLSGLVLVPLLGFAVGWCLGGREPDSLARRATAF